MVPKVAITLAHALPQSVGAVPLTLIIIGVIALFLAAGAVGTRRAERMVGDTSAPGTSASPAPEPLELSSHPSAWQLAGLVGLALLAATASTGPVDPSENLADTFVLVLLWGAVALSSAALGPWWRHVDPLRGANGLLAMAVGDPDQTSTRPLPHRMASIGALAGLVVWAWVQLLVTASVLTFQLLLIAYVAVHLWGAARYGPRWLVEVESLNVVSRTMGLLRPGGGGPVRRLSSMSDSTWVRSVPAALIGWSLTDLVIETEWWHGLGLSTSSSRVVGTALLVASIGGVLGLLHLVGDRVSVGPAFVAVAGGWVFAHYLSVLLIEGQGIPIWLSDPFASGADLLGRREGMVDPEPIPTTAMAVLQAIPFVLGHLAAVVVVQRRAAAAVRSARQIGPATFLPRALIAALLVGGMYLQLGGL